MRTMTSVTIAASLVCGFGAAAQAQSSPSSGGHDSAARGGCDYDCLIGFTHRYMDALVHKDPSRIPLAPDVKFTENDVEMPIGEGIWATISSVAPKALTAADTHTGNAAWMGTVEEHGDPAYYAMRLKIRNGQITEVETVVERKPGLPAPFGDPAKLEHDPAFSQVLPPQERRGVSACAT